MITKSMIKRKYQSLFNKNFCVPNHLDQIKSQLVFEKQIKMSKKAPLFINLLAKSQIILGSIFLFLTFNKAFMKTKSNQGNGSPLLYLLFALLTIALYILFMILKRRKYK